ncbi:MAG TPA: elongation factor G [Spirochaetota bacterium]|nr:elongation factor G [Spirochaetota bacterium]HOS31771.1 elongation factor G [Spirochaetota bacterium]HOS54523.1 elongation factor G [Spirochaetota bacterium]HQF77165.1 elongation factor G [Spirochaetota bacterium]HQH29610.1 elongation factor G [Spirochaetota bacterium]
MDNSKFIRNFGIIAHIDAGKTTTTERMLYLAGANRRLGEVDDGTAVTDWMEEEKERGITIVSAAVSCAWKDSLFHIIDTPGHVDFTAEVERTLRVLDGAVVVFCGVAGVQTQSLTVWLQADKFHIPRIIFINKLDRMGANFENVVNEIQLKLNKALLLINIPYYENDVLSGVIDLITMKLVIYNDDGFVKLESDIPSEFSDSARNFRDKLIDVATQFDDELLELVLNDNATEEDIIKSIRAGALSLKYIPVFCGASYKNIGVTNLLDGVDNYLPSPDDIGYCEGLILKKGIREKIFFDEDDKPVVYIFKTQFNKEKGLMSYVRIYKGSISTGDTIYNARTKKKERIHDILKVFSDKFERVDKAESGSIVVLIGLKNSVTGDTLSNENDQVILETLVFPEPVIFVKVELKNSIDAEKFNVALSRLLLEDPTISCKEDKDAGQILIGGMGELHIDIFLERVRREYNVDLKSGAPQVIYRETPKKSGSYVYEFDKKISGAVNHATVSLKVSPLSNGEGVKIINNANALNYPTEALDAINSGIKAALLSGPEGAYPVVDIQIEIENIEYDVSKTNLLALEASSNLCLSYLLRDVETYLLEPVMKCEIDIPGNYTGSVIGDLQSRGGIVIDIVKKYDNDVVVAKSPLKKMFGYTTSLRSLTQGLGTFTMEFLEFAKKIE